MSALSSGLGVVGMLAPIVAISQFGKFAENTQDDQDLLDVEQVAFVRRPRVLEFQAWVSSPF